MRETLGAARVAAVAVLLAVTVVGLRASGVLSHIPDSTAAGANGAVLATTLAAGEGIAVIAFILVLVSARPQHPPNDDEDTELWRPHFPWWAKTLGVLVAFAALISPFVILFARKSRNNPIPVLRNAGILRSPTGRLSEAGPGSFWPVIVGMGGAILVVLTMTVLSRRRRRRAYVPPRNRDRRVAALLDALAAGSDALEANRDPRTAIIACYAAMERGFAAAGSSPAASDTPAEVLARAADMIRSGAAEALTILFRRARYSTEPMTSADSDAAASALAQMRADLEDLLDQQAPELAGALS